MSRGLQALHGFKILLKPPRIGVLGVLGGFHLVNAFFYRNLQKPCNTYVLPAFKRATAGQKYFEKLKNSA
jgi:hypothetical protein